MRNGLLTALLMLCLSSAGASADSQPGQDDPLEPHVDTPPVLLYQSSPYLILNIATVRAAVDWATITDVAAVDLTGDGARDLAVAWYVTDSSYPQNTRRMLSVFINSQATFEQRVDLDLYVPDPDFPPRSIFRLGTGDIGCGDFDGDGDIDLVVAPFFGDELWFIENVRPGVFQQHLRFPFGFNSAGFFMTPPEILAADFDGDGRDDVAYIGDPTNDWDGQMVHFWKTDGAIADIYRVMWEGFYSEHQLHEKRGAAIADFDLDGRPDLCFTGTAQIGEQMDAPVLMFWYALDTATRTFLVHNEYPSIVCSDAVAVHPNPSCPPGVLLSDLNGSRIRYCAHTCEQGLDFLEKAGETGYAYTHPGRGMAEATADVDGDGDLDLVTKERVGDASDERQIEITLCSRRGSIWKRVDPCPIDTTGFRDEWRNPILRPNNLAVADLLGNSLPEIVAGFGLRPELPEQDREGTATLDVALWMNSCIGDVNLDGRTGPEDVTAFWQAMGSCHGDDSFNPNADFDKSGCIDDTDWNILVEDAGCDCIGGGPDAD